MAGCVIIEVFLFFLNYLSVEQTVIDASSSPWVAAAVVAAIAVFVDVLIDTNFIKQMSTF